MAQTLHQQAVALHQAGRLAEAEALYRKALSAQPNDANSMHLLGMLLANTGRADQGIDLMQRSIRLRPNFPPFFMNLGGALNTLGRLEEAEAALRSADSLAPGHPDSLAMLSDVLRKKGQPVSAIAAARQALKNDPQHPGALNSLGNALLDAKKTQEAAAAFRKSISAQPDLAEPYVGLAATLKKSGDLLEAVAELRKAIALKSNYADAYNSLGETLKETGETDEAISMFRQATVHKPDLAVAWFNLGTNLADEQRWAEAAEALRTLVKIEPRNAGAHNNLGWVGRQARMFDQSLGAFRRAVELDPNSGIALANLGCILYDMGKPAEALDTVRRAIKIEPKCGHAYCKLGDLLTLQNKFDEAAEAFKKAVELSPDAGEALNNLGYIQRDQSFVNEAIQTFRKAVLCNPKSYARHSNVVFATLYVPDLPPVEAFAEAVAWGQKHADPLPRYPKPPRKHSQAKINVGYVSGDFKSHVVGYILLQILKQHDRENFHITCYANVEKPDAITEVFKENCDRWRDIITMDDRSAAQMVRDDEIDILVDPSGHTASHRLLIFARKPAPVQINYVGYPATTGITAMDYRVTDAIADPPAETERFHTEKLLRIPECFLCIPPSKDAPEVTPPPLARRGFVTFGSLNILAKINPPLIASWCRILNATPGSKLMMKTRMLTEASVVKHLRELFQAGGLGEDRVEFIHWTETHREHMSTYHNVDIALDSFPYNGTSTTFDALWMGVPVITRAGITHVQRVGASMLTAIGHPELIAHSEAEYVDLSVRLAHDPARLTKLRSELRENVRTSALNNPQRLTRNLEDLYRQALTEVYKS